ERNGAEDEAAQEAVDDPGQQSHPPPRQGLAVGRRRAPHRAGVAAAGHRLAPAAGLLAVLVLPLRRAILARLLAAVLPRLLAAILPGLLSRCGVLALLSALALALLSVLSLLAGPVQSRLLPRAGVLGPHDAVPVAQQVAVLRVVVPACIACVHAP